MTYGGDPYSYTLEAALKQSTGRKPLDGANADEVFWRSHFDPPTAEGLRRHAERYGPEQVREVANLYGVPLTVKTGPKPKRQRRNGVAAQVVDLRARGLLPEAIGDTLNLSDRRVKQILGRSL